MAKFLNSTGISYHLENLIKNANERLFLISPYLKFNPRIKQLLDERNRLRLDIRIIYGKVDLQTEESNWLKSLDSIKVLFCKNLHAKCYLSENDSISIEKVVPKVEPSRKQRQKEEGNCIRCGTEIKLDPKHPLCKKCYQSWSKYSDKTYTENYCHICGAKTQSSMEKPVCLSC